jgi:hypothetical protein
MTVSRLSMCLHRNIMIYRRVCLLYRTVYNIVVRPEQLWRIWLTREIMLYACCTRRSGNSWFSTALSQRPPRAVRVIIPSPTPVVLKNDWLASVTARAEMKLLRWRIKTQTLAKKSSSSSSSSSRELLYDFDHNLYYMYIRKVVTCVRIQILLCGGDKKRKPSIPCVHRIIWPNSLRRKTIDLVIITGSFFSWVAFFPLTRGHQTLAMYIIYDIQHDIIKWCRIRKKRLTRLNTKIQKYKLNGNSAITIIIKKI